MDVICKVCQKPIPYKGKGRPPLFHTECRGKGRKPRKCKKQKIKDFCDAAFVGYQFKILGRGKQIKGRKEMAKTVKCVMVEHPDSGFASCRGLRMKGRCPKGIGEGDNIAVRSTGAESSPSM